MHAMRAIDRALAGALPHGSLFAVGGRVRDEVRAALGQSGEAENDLDYVVIGVRPDTLRRRLESLGRVGLVGAAFSVFKLTLDGITVDVALPRRERSSGIAHRDFDVVSGPDVPLEDDLGRRDFRMNMLARALPGGTLVDPYGGQADIAARRIDVVRDEAFEEDPLRILRACQFAARLGYEPTQRARAAMTAAGPLVASVSAERTGAELLKLIERAERPSLGFDLMHVVGALGAVWPELAEGCGIEQNEWHAYDVYRHNLETLDAAPQGDAILRLAALLHDVGKPRTKEGPHFYRHEQVGAEMAADMLGRLRFSGDVATAVPHLIAYHMYVADPELSDAAIRRFIRRIGIGQLSRQFALRHADIAGSGLAKRDDSNERFEARVWAEVERKPPFSIRDLAIDGEAVISALVRHHCVAPGFRGDARVGEALRYLFEQVTDVPERNEPSTLRALLDAYLETHG